MKQDTKKVVVVGALAVVLLAVGTFQFLGKGGGASAPTTTVEEPAEQEKSDGGTPEQAEAQAEGTSSGDAEPQAAQAGTGTQARAGAAQPKLFAMAPLPVRDPFRPKAVQLNEPEPEPEPQPAPAQPAPLTRRQSPNAPFDLAGATPLNPMITGTLPSVGGAMPMGAHAGAPAAQEPVFRLRGVVSGKTPMAVLEDGTGRQRLVEVGGYLDAESRIASIQGETITIVRNGQRKSLTIQEGTVGSN